MSTAMLTLAVLALLSSGGPGRAQGGARLLPGDYQVTIRVELPHMEDVGHSTEAVYHICVTAGDVGTHGLAALSELNPLRDCPPSSVHHKGDTLTFNIVCPGSDAAVGSAKYTLQDERFAGSITVKMGGKNMTMVERQSGRRVGNCLE